MKHSEVVSEIIKEMCCKKIAEIGVFRGETAEAVLFSVGSIIDEYWAIDQWNVVPKEGHRSWSKWTINDWDSIYMQAVKKLGHFDKLKILRAASVVAASMFHKEYFDFVYIDANHMYEYVLNDITSWLPLVKKGGIIGGHDYFNSSKSKVKKAVDNFFGKGNIVEKPDTVWIKYL